MSICLCSVYAKYYTNIGGEIKLTRNLDLNFLRLSYSNTLIVQLALFYSDIHSLPLPNRQLLCQLNAALGLYVVDTCNTTYNPI